MYFEFSFCKTYLFHHMRLYIDTMPQCNRYPYDPKRMLMHALHINLLITFLKILENELIIHVYKLYNKSSVYHVILYID